MASSDGLSLTRSARRRAPRIHTRPRPVIEPAATLEDRLPRWVLGGLLILFGVQLVIAL
ncbi:MAG: hypothetical protein KC420_05605 [Myxococcales bacterium]|nr:hypothetical protein [Myxococcales bacterium]MCB9566775.1 hypothetical protein [Myxococcales bacterium]MCB9704511.1 hypothetical protein [Myxococcales bacterium]